MIYLKEYLLTPTVYSEHFSHMPSVRSLIYKVGYVYPREAQNLFGHYRTKAQLLLIFVYKKLSFTHIHMFGHLYSISVSVILSYIVYNFSILRPKVVYLSLVEQVYRLYNLKQQKIYNTL